MGERRGQVRPRYGRVTAALSSLGVTTVECNVEVETASQHCDGRTVVDRWNVTDGPRNCKAGVDVDAQRFLELLVERIATLA